MRTRPRPRQRGCRPANHRRHRSRRGGNRRSCRRGWAHPRHNVLGTHPAQLLPCHDLDVGSGPTAVPTRLPAPIAVPWPGLRILNAQCAPQVTLVLLLPSGQAQQAPPSRGTRLPSGLSRGRVALGRPQSPRRSRSDLRSSTSEAVGSCSGAAGGLFGSIGHEAARPAA